MLLLILLLMLLCVMLVRSIVNMRVCDVKATKAAWSEGISFKARGASR